jgi:hypothetical protein
MQVNKMAVKIVGPTVNTIHTTPDSIGGANLVRIYSANVSVITQTTAAGGAIGDITVPAASATLLIKSPTDLLSASVAVSCTPVAYY